MPIIPFAEYIEKTDLLTFSDAGLKLVHEPRPKVTRHSGSIRVSQVKLYLILSQVNTVSSYRGRMPVYVSHPEIYHIPVGSEYIDFSEWNGESLKYTEQELKNS